MNTTTISRPALAALTLAATLSAASAWAMPGMMGPQHIKLMAAPPAKMAGLQNATGYADVDAARRTVKFSITLARGTRLPAGNVLEGWLSTSGKSTASMADQKFGPAFGKKDMAMKSREIPYALSTGLLRRVGNSRTYVGRFHIDNPFTPYGAVAITLESDGNSGNYDPRPGTPLLVGMIPSGSMMGSR